MQDLVFLLMNMRLETVSGAGIGIMMNKFDIVEEHARESI